jgi:hypothetical protein
MSRLFRRVAMCVVILFVSFVPFVPFVSFPSAQSPMPGQGSQMPDARQMSGMPLPVPDLPAGTVTARVFRGSLASPIPGQSVELAGPDGTQTAKGDDTGRATFSGLKPGVRVKVAVVVDGERIESQEFTVPSAGGIRMALVATDPEMEKRAEADRALAKEPPVTGAVVLGEQSRLVLEVHDDSLTVFNIMEIVNTARRPVQTGAPLVFQLPSHAQGAGMLEGSAPGGVAAGDRVTVTGPFAPGKTVIQFAYSIPLGAESIAIEQRMPAQLAQFSVIAQKIGAMRLASPQIAQQRDMSSEGQVYVVGQGGAVKAGDVVSLTLTGLPHRPSWPKTLSLVAAVVILAGGAWGAVRNRETPKQAGRRGQLQARREKLFSELAALEAQRRKGSVDARAYAARREALVTALEEVYAGIEREVA